MFRKAEAIVGLLVILAVLALSVYVYTLRAAHKNATSANQALSGDAAAATTYTRAYKKVIAEEKKDNERMDEALAANPAWSEQPVPDDVADLLRYHQDAAD